MFGILELDDNGRRLAAAVAIKVNILGAGGGVAEALKEAIT